jgi:predicted Ser/Thr protein kinase
MGVINPEDTITYENIKSFKDRIITISIPYVLDYNTEVNIYENKFGQEIINAFFPRTINNFAKIIVSTRMNTETSLFDNWLETPELYKNYIDENLLLLKMELYTGKIPRWLDDKDILNFKKEIRKRLISGTILEGKTGVSGRQSLNLFNKLISKYGCKKQSITMLNIIDFVKSESDFKTKIPAKFTDALFNLYEYNILDEVKESIYFYNETKMKRDIKNYLFALNFEKGEKITSHYTGDIIELNDDFYNSIEPFLYGNDIDEKSIIKLRKEEHITYITNTLSKEIKVKEKTIEQTEQFEYLLRKYSDNLKQFALAPYENNSHFKRCIESFNTPAFNKFENPLKKTVNRLITNMGNKFGYTEESAQHIILYVIENNLNERFKNFGIK